MIKKCAICNSELFKDETGELFCPDCYAGEFLKTFDEKDDSWMKNKFKVIQPKTKPITIRMNVSDIEKAKTLAKIKGLPYQTLLKEIIHNNLKEEFI